MTKDLRTDEHISYCTILYRVRDPSYR